MAETNREMVMLDPRRNQSSERKKLYEEMLLKEIPGTARANEPMHAVLESELQQSDKAGGEAQNVRNHALIHYLATLATSNDTKDTFDFDFVESLLNNGADINSTDKTGQTVFHEVARSWNIDVARFLIAHGANVNQQDQFGRSPLHVAAAVDYAEMVEFLLENGADINIKTHGEDQQPVHFAAKNDAINSLQMLLGYGANIDARDSKNRTPLQVSAEMNRSKAAKLLINEGAPAGVYDNLGNSALSLLIEKIPEVALEAMDQFHSTDTINRKEFYFLNYLEGPKLKEQKTPARTPLEIAVQNERFDIILHPVMQRLINVKWQMYGKWGAVLDLVVNLVYAILWTVLAVTLPKQGRDLYLPIGPNSWRLTIGIILILLTVLEIRKQITNTIKTRHELKNWKEWRAAELERDLQYCHPRWPQETQYLKSETKAVRNLSLISGSDWWIYFDWVALVFILATIISHVTFFHYSTDTSKEVHHYITIPLLLTLWLRIFKYARPFESAGPFVVIFGSVMGDIVKWGFLNVVITIPFACAFWITFGAISLKPVEGYDNVGPLMYNMFSMMVVGDHNYENLEKANPVMARILCGSFIAVAAIITLNLLIALLTNTFERLYENAVANAVMQRARTILLLQKSLRKKQKRRYYRFIKENGSPEVIRNDLGSIFTTDREDHATIERVGEDIKVIINVLGEQFGRRFGRKKKKTDMEFVKMDVSKVKRFQEELVNDVKNMKLTLQGVQEMMEQLKQNSNNNNNNNNNSNNNNNNSNNNDDDNDNAESTGKKPNVGSGPPTLSTVVKPIASHRAMLKKKNVIQDFKFKKMLRDNSQDESETEETDFASATSSEKSGEKSKRSRTKKKNQRSLADDGDDNKRVSKTEEQFVGGVPYPSARPSTSHRLNEVGRYEYYNHQLTYPEVYPQHSIEGQAYPKGSHQVTTQNTAYSLAHPQPTIRYPAYPLPHSQTTIRDSPYTPASSFQYSPYSETTILDSPHTPARTDLAIQYPPHTQTTIQNSPYTPTRSNPTIRKVVQDPRFIQTPSNYQMAPPIHDQNKQVSSSAYPQYPQQGSHFNSASQRFLIKPDAFPVGHEQGYQDHRRFQEPHAQSYMRGNSFENQGFPNHTAPKPEFAAVANPMMHQRPAVRYENSTPIQNSQKPLGVLNNGFQQDKTDDENRGRLTNDRYGQVLNQPDFPGASKFDSIGDSELSAFNHHQRPKQFHPPQSPVPRRPEPHQQNIQTREISPSIESNSPRTDFQPIDDNHSEIEAPETNLVHDAPFEDESGDQESKTSPQMETIKDSPLTQKLEIIEPSESAQVTTQLESNPKNPIRPSTPMAPEIKVKVDFFQEKINEKNTGVQKSKAEDHEQGIQRDTDETWHPTETAEDATGEISKDLAERSSTAEQNFQDINEFLPPPPESVTIDEQELSEVEIGDRDQIPVKDVVQGAENLEVFSGLSSPVAKESNNNDSKLNEHQEKVALWQEVAQDEISSDTDLSQTFSTAEEQRNEGERKDDGGSEDDDEENKEDSNIDDSKLNEHEEKVTLSQEPAQDETSSDTALSQTSSTAKEQRDEEGRKDDGGSEDDDEENKKRRTSL